MSVQKCILGLSIGLVTTSSVAVGGDGTCTAYGVMLDSVSEWNFHPRGVHTENSGYAQQAGARLRILDYRAPADVQLAYNEIIHDRAITDLAVHKNTVFASSNSVSFLTRARADDLDNVWVGGGVLQTSMNGEMASDGEFLGIEKEFVDGNRFAMYEIDSASVLQFLGNIAHPLHPNHSFSHLVMRDGVLYATTPSRVYSYDIRNDSHPWPATQSAFTGGVNEGMDLCDERWLAVQVEDTFRVFDATGRQNLVEVASFGSNDGGASPISLTIRDDLLLVGFEDDTTTVFDFSEPTSPVAIGQVNGISINIHLNDDLILAGGSPGGIFRTFQVTICCGVGGADITGDGVLNFFDVSAFIGLYSSGSLDADFTGDGVLDFFDVSAFINSYTSGCP